jgi:hypothetical protein
VASIGSHARDYDLKHSSWQRHCFLQPMKSISAGRLPEVDMFDLLVYAVLFLGFPLGVLVGYRWRDRVSRKRRERFLSERGKRPDA